VASKINDTDELICGVEKDTQSLKSNTWLPKWTAGAGNGLGFSDWHMHVVVYGITGQWGAAV